MIDFNYWTDQRAVKDHSRPTRNRDRRFIDIVDRSIYNEIIPNKVTGVGAGQRPADPARVAQQVHQRTDASFFGTGHDGASKDLC